MASSSIDVCAQPIKRLQELIDSEDFIKVGETWGPATVKGFGINEATGVKLVVCDYGESPLFLLLTLDVWRNKHWLSKLWDSPTTGMIMNAHPDELDGGPTPETGSEWKHYKNSTTIYKVIGTGIEQVYDSIQPCVVYYDTSGKYKFYWVRELSSWNGTTQDNQKRFVQEKQ